MIQETHLPPLDVAILRELHSDGRISNVELARRAHLSPPATHASVKRLEKEGLIRRYGATLDREKADFETRWVLSEIKAATALPLK